MILSFLNKQVELSQPDYLRWLEQWDDRRIVVKNLRRYIMGRCCFCEAFRLERVGRESNCTYCPLMAAYGMEGKDRVEGCVVLLESILGDKGSNCALSWGLIFHRDFLVVCGQRGKDSLRKVREVIINSVESWEDRDGLETHFEPPEEKADGTNQKKG